MTRVDRVGAVAALWAAGVSALTVLGLILELIWDVSGQWMATTLTLGFALVVIPLGLAWLQRRYTDGVMASMGSMLPPTATGPQSFTTAEGGAVVRPAKPLAPDNETTLIYSPAGPESAGLPVGAPVPPEQWFNGGHRP